MSTQVSVRPFRHAWWVVPIAVVFAVVVGLVGRAVWTPKPVVEEPIDELKPSAKSGLFDPPTKPDLAAATASNFHGVELMDQLEFTEARKEFATAVRAAPDLLPARINYGIATFAELPSDINAMTAQVQKAQQVLRGVLARDPDNTHAHYTLGMIDMYTGHYADAYPHFQKVNQLDPDDAFSWLRLGTTHPDGMHSVASKPFFARALALDPKLNEARYRLFLITRAEGNEQQAEELLTEHDRLWRSDEATKSGILFGEMGKYADVIGRDPAKPGEYGGDPPKRRKWGWAGLDRGSKSK